MIRYVQVVIIVTIVCVVNGLVGLAAHGVFTVDVAGVAVSLSVFALFEALKK